MLRIFKNQKRILTFLADRRPHNGRAYATMLCLSVCRVHVTYVLWLNGAS